MLIKERETTRNWQPIIKQFEAIANGFFGFPVPLADSTTCCVEDGIIPFVPVRSAKCGL